MKEPLRTTLNVSVTTAKPCASGDLRVVMTPDLLLGRSNPRSRRRHRAPQLTMILYAEIR
jgi:hypothetical protein